MVFGQRGNVTKEAEAIKPTDLSPNLAESKQRYALPQNLGRTFVKTVCGLMVNHVERDG